MLFWATFGPTCRGSATGLDFDLVADPGSNPDPDPSSIVRIRQLRKLEIKISIAATIRFQLL